MTDAYPAARMHLVALIALPAMVTMLAVPAVAQESVKRPALEATSSFLQVRDLQVLCARDKDACVAYIEAASDMVKFVQATGSIPPRYCTDSKVTLGKLAGEVVEYLGSHDEFASQGAAGAVWAALSETHPCAVSK